MRAAMLSTVRDRCGIGDYTTTLQEGLASCGIDVVRVSLDAQRRAEPTFVRDVLDDVSRARADIVHVQHDYSFFGGIVPRLGPLERRLLRLMDVPELPARSTWFDIFANVRLPLVITLHELIDPVTDARDQGVRLAMHYAVVRDAARLTFDAADAVIVHSEERKARLCMLGINATKIHVIPLAIPQAPLLARPAARARLRLNDKDLVLLTAGFLSARKGVDRLVRAVARLPSRFVLVVAGDARDDAGRAHRDDLQRLAGELGVSARVRFTGYLEPNEMAEWLAAADVYALTPLEMGGGSRSLATGISAGLPVVAWSHPSMAALAREHGCIDLVPYDDIDALVTRLAILGEEPALLEDLRRRSVVARTASAPDVEGNRTRLVYERAIAQQRGRATRAPNRIGTRRFVGLAVAVATRRFAPLH